MKMTATLKKHLKALDTPNMEIPTGLYVSFERIINGCAKMATYEETTPLTKYLKKSGLKWEYTANYSALIIYN